MFEPFYFTNLDGITVTFYQDSFALRRACIGSDTPDSWRAYLDGQAEVYK